MSDYVEWQQEGGPKVRIHRRVLGGLAHEGRDDFRGIALGAASAETGEVLIEDYEPLDDGGDVEASLASRHSLPAVGYFRAVSGEDVQISDYDRALFSRNFRDALDVLLLFQLRGGTAELAGAYVKPAAQPARRTEPAAPPPDAAPAHRPLYRDARPLAAPLPEPVRPRRTPLQDRKPVDLPLDADEPPPARSRRRYLWPVLAVAGGFLLGEVAYLAMRSEKPRLASVPQQTTQPVRTSPAPAAAPPAVTPAPGTAPGIANPSPFEADRIDPAAGPANKAEIQLQISGVLRRWADSLLNDDVETHVSLYAPTVSPYFTKRAVRRSQIQEETDRMLDRYGQMTTYKISDVTVAPVDANHAIANFRKHWETDGGNFAGEEREQMKFVREGSQWLIASEQELKVYWVRKK